jgi:lipoprotein-releasing system ATP-binding protein
MAEQEISESYSNDKVIELRKVNKIYKGAIDTQVLYDIDFSIEKGSFNSLIGASGSGKSTLLNIIGTLDRATSGEVIISGKDTAKLNKNQLAELRNRTIGFVFQFHYLLPEFTALENVLIPYNIYGGNPTKEILARADELFELMDIDKVKNNLSTKMSGGQQQRTAIARALINRPDIILADEPTGNLDSESTLNIYKIFREINAKYKTTFLIITHDRRIAQEAERILEIKDGRIVTDIRM